MSSPNVYLCLPLRLTRRSNAMKCYIVLPRIVLRIYLLHDVLKGVLLSSGPGAFQLPP